MQLSDIIDIIDIDVRVMVVYTEVMPLIWELCTNVTVVMWLNDIMNSESPAYCFLLILQISTVIPDLIRCTVLARLSFSDRHWRVARAHIKLASAYFDIKGSNKGSNQKHKMCITCAT
jgi:hypothetical protein